MHCTPHATMCIAFEDNLVSVLKLASEILALTPERPDSFLDLKFSKDVL